MKKILIITSSAFLLIFIILEVGLRLSGLQPGKNKNTSNLQITPPELFKADSVLGFKMNPGKYHFKQFSSEYDMTINAAGHRVVAAPDSVSAGNKPRIIFLGGPSTFGHGVNDNETYPYFMQRRLAGYDIINLGQLNVGLAESYVQVSSLKDLKKGDVVVYAYHWRHDDRAKQLLKKFNNAGPNLVDLVKQYSYITLDDNLEPHLHKFRQQSLPFSRYSALINYLEEAYNAKLNYSEGTHGQAEKAIAAMAQICGNKGCKFLLVYWRKDEYMDGTLNYCRKNGVTAIHFPAHISFTHAGDHVPIRDSNIAFADSLINHLIIENMLDTTLLRR